MKPAVELRSTAGLPSAGRPAAAAVRPAGAVASRAAQTRRAALLFVAPAGLIFLVLIAYPLFRVLWYSLHYVNLVNPTQTGFAGADNYTTVLTDEDFWPSLWHSFVWTTLSVAGEYALGLASAVALAQPVRGRAIFRGIIIIPWVIPIVVAGLNWTWLLTPDYGVLNLWAVRLGLLKTPFYWLGSLDTALLTVVFVNIWRSFPFYTISLLAAMQAIPQEIQEAAAVDGAGTLRRFFVITMPHLRVVSYTLIFIHVIWTAINFDFIYVMTEGGPLDASETLPIMIYRYAMQNFDVGAACALATMMMAFMITTFTVYYYGALRRSRAA